MQALPSEPGSGQPGGGYTEMLSVAAAGARDAWAVGEICPQQGDARCDRLLVEHWAAARWRTIPSPPGTGASIPPTVISASSATNAWVFADTVDLTTRASRWNGSSWASFSFPRELRTTAAAVFSRTDAWALGELYGGEIHRPYPRPYVVRFNGRRWLRVPSPLVPQDASAVAANDIWTVGTLTGPGEVWSAAHWNGSSWRTLRFPRLPPAVRESAVIGNAAIEAFSARDAWVDIGLTTGIASYGIIVLHWNGRAWSRVPVPYRTQAAGDISQDGGGIWMYAIGPAAPTGAPVYLYHYSNGQWSRQRARPWVARPPRWACCPGARVQVRGGPRPTLGPGDCCCVTSPNLDSRRADQVSLPPASLPVTREDASTSMSLAERAYEDLLNRDPVRGGSRHVRDLGFSGQVPGTRPAAVSRTG